MRKSSPNPFEWNSPITWNSFKRAQCWVSAHNRSPLKRYSLSARVRRTVNNESSPLETCVSSLAGLETFYLNWRLWGKVFLLMFSWPLCSSRVDSQFYTPVPPRCGRLLCHQPGSILLLMKQKMKSSLQLFITGRREPFIIVSRWEAGAPCLIHVAASLWNC